MEIRIGSHYGLPHLSGLNLQKVVVDMFNSKDLDNVRILCKDDNYDIKVYLIKKCSGISMYYKTENYEDTLIIRCGERVEEVFRTSYDPDVIYMVPDDQRNWNVQLTIFNANIDMRRYSNIQKNMDYRLIPMILNSSIPIESRLNIWKMKVHGKIYEPGIIGHLNFNSVKRTKTEKIAYELQPVMFLNL